MTWTPFYYEANQAWGLIDSPEEWERIIRNHMSGWNEDESERPVVVKRLLEAQSNSYKDSGRTTPDFGLYAEYTGDDNLRDFAARHGMILDTTNMNFEHATPPAKLRWLAALIEGRYRDVFSQSVSNLCVIGIGSRVDETGAFIRDDTFGTSDFVRKFGIAQHDASALLLSHYDRLGIGEPSVKLRTVTADIAACLLRKLADRYERKQI